MKSVTTWMPLYVGDYDKKTSRLTLAEDGAYMRLIRDYWTNGPPPDDDHRIASILRVDVREWRKIRPAIVAYFVIEGGRWTHPRVEKELAKARNRRDTAAENGRQGGRPKNPAGSENKPSGLAKDNPEHNPNHNPEKSSPPSHSPTFGGEEEREESSRDEVGTQVGDQPATVVAFTARGRS